MSRLPRLASSLLLCCAALLPAPAPAGAGPPVADEAPDSAPEFTLVTLNLYHDRDDWPKRRVQIVDTLRALEPDAIVLQEVLQLLRGQLEDGLVFLEAGDDLLDHVLGAIKQLPVRRALAGIAIASLGKTIEQASGRMTAAVEQRIVQHRHLDVRDHQAAEQSGGTR